jgi:chromosome segregation ATPase
MKDNELYELLEDISGVKTYEAKKEEAFKILENACNNY